MDATQTPELIDRIWWVDRGGRLEHRNYGNGSLEAVVRAGRVGAGKNARGGQEREKRERDREREKRRRERESNRLESRCEWFGS